ncbi:response regulator [Candidatus Methylomirabilis sp.]|uniref:response regulator n=1 Tax=Candidatus Methylomirabilis sp. TaxID=2032687 RepID=UPI003C77F1D6
MRQAKTHRPDFILLDINLPHIDGLTLARMLREDPETRAITILAVSAYSVAGDKERIRQAGCDGFIPEPIDTKTFLQTIATFLDREKAQQGRPGRSRLRCDNGHRLPHLLIFPPASPATL